MGIEQARSAAKTTIVGVWILVGLLIVALAWETLNSPRGVNLYVLGLGPWLSLFFVCIPIAVLVTVCLWGWRVVAVNWVKAAGAGILMVGGVLGLLLDTVNRSRDIGDANMLTCRLSSKWIAQDRNRSTIAEFNCNSWVLALAIPRDLWDSLALETKVVLPVHSGFLGRPWVPFDQIKTSP